MACEGWESARAPRRWWVARCRPNRLGFLGRVCQDKGQEGRTLGMLELILGTRSLIPGGVRGAGWVGGLALAFSCLFVCPPTTIWQQANKGSRRAGRQDRRRRFLSVCLLYPTVMDVGRKLQRCVLCDVCRKKTARQTRRHQIRSDQTPGNAKLQRAAAPSIPQVVVMAGPQCHRLDMSASLCLPRYSRWP